MIEVSGVKVNVFVIHKSNGSVVVAFDKRSHSDMIKAWLAAWQKLAEQSSVASAQEAKTKLQHEAVSKSVLDGIGDVDADDAVFAQEPVCIPVMECMLMFDGVKEKDGYGAAAILPNTIESIALMDYDDISGILSKIEKKRSAEP